MRRWISTVAVSPVGIVVGVRLLISAIVILGGITAVTDDDYHRLVLAQTFAENPTLESIRGTWLPLPFIVYGAAFKLFGPALWLAHGIGVLLGGRRMGTDTLP